jgi:hypothetical protein
MLLNTNLLTYRERGGERGGMRTGLRQRQDSQSRQTQFGVKFTADKNNCERDGERERD